MSHVSDNSEIGDDYDVSEIWLDGDGVGFAKVEGEGKKNGRQMIEITH